MFLERTGNGSHAFLGLHGWSGTHRTFDPLIENLPSEVSFFSIDLPGCGQSEKPSQWTVSAVADQLAAAVAALPHPLTLVGHCSGALLALEVAKRLGDHVERLVLLDIFAFFPWYFRVFLNPYFGRYAYYSTFANPLGRLLTNASLRGKRSETTTLTGGFAEANHSVTYHYLQMLADFPLPETFGMLRQPIDIVYGEKTFGAVRESAKLWQSVWPQARQWCLTGAGHLPILEATSQLQELLFRKGVISDACPASSHIAN